MATGQEVREPGAGFEVALIAAAFAVMAAGVTVWLGARLAIVIGGTGGQVSGGIGDWLPVAVRLARGQPPAEAWGELATDLPAPPIYWIAHRRRRRRRCRGRRRVGVGVAAHRRPRPIVDGSGSAPKPAKHSPTKSPRWPSLICVRRRGGCCSGRMLPRGPLLATEDRVRHPLKRSKARRQGNRGSVALIGPTGSGKTALAASALVTWDGPVVAVSVKRDLYDTTAAARAARGEIAVFDPGMATGLASARWSPLEAVTTSSGALRTGRALAQAIPRSGVTNADYWAKHGEKLLGAFMGVAGLSRLLVAPPGDAPYPVVNMEHIATWVTTMADATDPVINRLLKAGLDKTQPLEVKLIARHASVTFVGVAKEDHKIRSSIYSTASHAIDPWLEPSVAHSATDDPRHSYASDRDLGAPAPVHRPRLADGPARPASPTPCTWPPHSPSSSGSPPCSAACSPTSKTPSTPGTSPGAASTSRCSSSSTKPASSSSAGCPAEVSTIAALGAFFVTCWQNLSQIQHRYGTLADAVLSGHRTKCFFAGVDDLTTTRYLTGLLGSEYVTRMSTSNDVAECLRWRPWRPPQRLPIRAARRLRAGQHGAPDEPRRSRAAARHPPTRSPRGGSLVGTEGARRPRPPRRRRPPEPT